MTLPNTSSGYGWQCPSCKTWVPAGQSHACASYQYPQTYGYYSQWIDPAMLERIAKSLEEIASQLTKRALDSATYERDGLLFCKTCGSGMGAVEDEPPSQ